eukprot:scaffold1887_cov267-Chaetoceros_neogracile.AAC.4
MAVSRFNIASNKKTALMKQQMREISKLLAENKEEKARIRAEALIRDDSTLEAYEILQLTCELLFERIKLISTSKTVPEDLKSSISTLVWASNRVDVKELNEIRKQIKAKFGKQFDSDAYENKNDICNERVVAKLSVQPPSAYLVQTYLEKIADQFDVAWSPKNKLKADQLAGPMAAPVGYSVNIAPGTGLVPVLAYAAEEETATDAMSEIRGSIGGSSPPSEVAPATTSVASASAASRYSGHSRASAVSEEEEAKRYSNEIPVAQIFSQPTEDSDIFIPAAPGMEDKKPPADDFDDLQARFNNLKRK